MASIKAASRAPAADDTARRRLGVMLFLVAAFVSFLLSVGLWFTDNHQEALFVGLWVPSILTAGTFWALVAVQPS